MNFPGRNQRGPDPYAGLARGEELKPDMSRVGVVDDGSTAWPERLEQARRTWREARAEDFEQLDRRGRRWRDRGSGVEYKALDGAPLLAVGGAETRGASCFFVASGRIFVLRRADYDDTIRQPMGFVISREVPS